MYLAGKCKKIYDSKKTLFVIFIFTGFASMVGLLVIFCIRNKMNIVHVNSYSLV